MKALVVILLALLTTPNYAQQCYDYVIISTRGTDEPQGPSIAFPGMINATLSVFPGGIEYDTVYPAGQKTEGLGAQDITRYIDQGICYCPDQLYVLLGYSLGAAATALALHEYDDENSWGYQAIAAVITVGNPLQRANESSVVDQNNGSSTRPYQGVLFDEAGAIPQSWYDSGKLKEICYTNDIVCVGAQPDALKDNFASHLRYGNTQSVQDIGSQWIADHLRAYGIDNNPRTSPLTVDAARFPGTAFFADVMSVVGTLGLRTPASPRQNRLIDWILEQLHSMSSIDVTIQESPLLKWETTDDRSLLESGSLSIQYSNGSTTSLPIIGAIPWTKPTNGSSVTKEIIYIPQGVNLTTTNIVDKIVIRDFGPTSALNYPIVFFPQIYRSNDTEALLNTSYDRPYTAAPDRDMIDAGLAGAAGYISMFNVPGHALESYYDPHSGTHFRQPGLYVGAETAAVLKSVANSTTKATINVNAIVANDTQRQITADLPGMTNDTIYVVCHTDGNTYVQDNGVSALLAMAQYFSDFDVQARNKTLKFVFTTGHLGYRFDTTGSLAAQLDATYDNDNTVLALALEHMGTKEILPASSPSGAANGNDLEFSGANELMVWCVGPSDALRNASVNAAKKLNLDRLLVTQGASIPDGNRAPMYASFGGIGTGFHQHLIPTAAIISGPWSLWAPSFGAEAIDFNRLRDQTMAFAEIIVAVNTLSKAEIAGGYLDDRAARANGTKLPAIDAPPPLFAPEPL